MKRTKWGRGTSVVKMWQKKLLHQESFSMLDILLFLISTPLRPAEHGHKTWRFTDLVWSQVCLDIPDTLLRFGRKEVPKKGNIIAQKIKEDSVNPKKSCPWPHPKHPKQSKDHLEEQSPQWKLVASIQQHETWCLSPFTVGHLPAGGTRRGI